MNRLLCEYPSAFGTIPTGKEAQMSVGKRILQMRMELKKSQRELCESTGLAVSHLSRLENDRIAPTVKTLGWC